MNRHTFVIQVHPGGHSTLENLSTHERIRIADMAAVGPQVERWLAELVATAPAEVLGDGGPIAEQR